MSAELLVRIVASQPAGEGLLPAELVANVRVAPEVIAGTRGREAFLGLVLEGAEKLHEAMLARRWVR
jgi:hypothetical protein